MREIQPMIIAIWCGFGKPNDINEFLRPFVTELQTLIIQGIHINGYTLSINIHCFVCDTPARAFLKGKLCYNFEQLKTISKIIIWKY